MKKSAEAFRTISEVAEWLETPPHVLRFWESKFHQLKPVKRAGGRRYYRPSDMELLAGIKKLLHEDGVTIRGVQKILRENGVKHVAAMCDRVIDGVEADETPAPAKAEAPTKAETPAQPAAPAPPAAEDAKIVALRPVPVEPPRAAPAPAPTPAVTAAEDDDGADSGTDAMTNIFAGLGDERPETPSRAPMLFPDLPEVPRKGGAIRMPPASPGFLAALPRVAETLRRIDPDELRPRADRLAQPTRALRALRDRIGAALAADAGR